MEHLLPGNLGVYNAYNINFYRLVWHGENATNDNAFWICNPSMNFYNILFNMDFSAASASYFYTAGSSNTNHFYNCTLPTYVQYLLRGRNYLTNCYGGFSVTNVANSSVSDWDYQTNVITNTPQVNSTTHRITEAESVWKNVGTGTNPDGTRADLGIFGGTYSWDWPDDIF